MFKSIVALLALTVSCSAFAGANQQAEGKYDRNLVDIIDACKRLEQNPQIKEFSSEIVCRGHKTYWIEAEPNQQPMKTEFLVRAEVVMKGDRYRVDEYAENMDSEDGIAQCNAYEEVRADYAPVTIRLTSCAELEELANEGRGNFCARHLENGTLLTNSEQTTGRTYNTCL